MKKRVMFGLVVVKMPTTIRPEIARSNKYHISKHRYYELKHFCLQYREWRGDKMKYRQMIHAVCSAADSELAEYIFKAVTEGRSYTYLKTALGMPCGRSMYFDRYRKFFWLLNDARR